MNRTAHPYDELYDVLFANSSTRTISGMRLDGDNTFLGESEYPIDAVIENSIFDSITISDSPITKLAFKNCSLKSLAITCSGNVNNIQFSDCKIDLLFITSKTVSPASGTVAIFGNETEIKKAIINISLDQLDAVRNCKIDEIEITGNQERTTGILTFDTKRAKTITLRELNNGQLSVTEGAGLVQVLRSSLGYCKIKSSTELDFYCIDTKLQNIFMSQNEGLHVDLHDSNITLWSLSGKNRLSLGIIGNCRFGEIRYLPNGHETFFESLRMIRASLESGTKLHFNNVRFREISFRNSENNGSIEFNSCEILINLEVRKSDLGNLILNNIELTSANNFILLDSNVEKVKFLNFRWQNNYLLQEKEVDDAGANLVVALRESYRQLKSNYQSNGNQIEALEFQRHELRIHYEVTKDKAKNKMSVDNIGNFLTLWTHYRVSNFGQNVLRPLGLLFLSHLILFNILLLTHPDFGYAPSFTPDSDATLKGIGQFLNTLLPTHGMELIGYDKKVNIMGITDTLIRILSAYFIFYFISASRKYHQKG